VVVSKRLDHGSATPEGPRLPGMTHLGVCDNLFQGRVVIPNGAMTSAATLQAVAEQYFWLMFN